MDAQRVTAPTVPVRWWSDGGFEAAWAASATFTTSAASAVSGADELRIVGVRGQGERKAARRAIRGALAAALAEVTGVPVAGIRVGGLPGEAPFASVSCGLRGERRVGVAISHDGELSVAAFRLDGGPVGIDVMQVIDVPDWEPVARDYLGPGCAAALGHVPAAARADAFARAWSEREAMLKCLGMPLAEWDPAETDRLGTCTCRAIALPAGYVGTVATATPTGTVTG